jgi:alpha-tubulin suppressor-like RCC1 family protein
MFGAPKTSRTRIPRLRTGLHVVTLLVAVVVGGCASSTLEDLEDAGSDLRDAPPDASAPGEDMGAPGDASNPGDGGTGPGDMSGDAGEDLGGDASMADMESPDGGGVDMGACGDRCSDTELCRAGSCVDLCQEQGAVCGEVTGDGATVDCGTCTQGSCIGGRCVDACRDAGAQCGTLYWSGAAVDCGTCGGVMESCFEHRCAQPGWRAMAAGSDHSCGLLTDGRVYCWGGNQFGQIGDGQAPTDRSDLFQVPSPNNAVDVDTETLHVCATRTSGSVWCWGYNNNSQVGGGALSGTTVRDTPYQLASPTSARLVAAGVTHSCAVDSVGDLICWGDNTSGQLGIGSFDGDKVGPTKSTRIADIVEIELGKFFGCALRDDGAVFCWGDDSDGRLGLGSMGSKFYPTRVTSLPTARDIAVGEAHACAVLQSGGVRCWGAGDDGQLGDGSRSDRTTPVEVSTLTDAVAIAAGQRHTCAIDRDRRLWCWGDNSRGQLGLGSMDARRETPARIGSLAGVLDVSAGHDHTCASTQSGSAFCWGDDTSGQLGPQATQNPERSPVPLP